MKLHALLLPALSILLALPAAAADFDGSKPLICAPVTAIDCLRGESCLSGLPEEFGAPAFMRIDFGKKIVAGPKTTTNILLLNKDKDQLLLQGREGGFGWNMALATDSGEMTLTLTNRHGTYVLFGSCTLQ